MERIRKPFQGVTNIIRFNWHFYVLAALLVGMIWIVNTALGTKFTAYATLLTGIIVLPIIVSLAVSIYVYDYSGLYTMPWLCGIKLQHGATIINVHAGLDEFSVFLRLRFPEATLRVFDFYDNNKHTEVSIKRARNAYPPFPGTTSISSDTLPTAESSADLILVALAAHEIRNEQERIRFFQELKRTIKPEGLIIVTEHLRDLPNFLAYSIGFFHFLSGISWNHTFSNSQLQIRQKLKTTPFINSYILTKNGTAY